MSITEYAGADWIESQLKYWNPKIVMSPLGINVANFLGELFYGIYHLDHKALKKVAWNDDFCIEVSVGWTNWATVDFDQLTRLVFLAHWMALRVEMNPSRYKYMRIMFHQRSRNGDTYQRHPTLAEAVSSFRNNVTFSEFLDVYK